MSSWLQQQWYRIGLWHLLLLPASWIFALLVSLRRLAYQSGLFHSYKLPVPVIIVGNISVGGTGKTPLVIWLVAVLKQAGYYPAIVSRGYGGSADKILAVSTDSDPDLVGDEPVLLAKRTNSPVWVGRNRVKAAQALLQTHPDCNVIISDDGLQHYQLKRDIEIAVIDGERGFGNGYLLPAGCLREPVARLMQVDAIVINGDGTTKTKFSLNAIFTSIYTQAPLYVMMHLQFGQFQHLQNKNLHCLAIDFKSKKIHAIAGIGHPERFFHTLETLGLDFERHAFADHYVFRLDDLQIMGADIILMTEKDAVKCAAFATECCWYLPVDAKLESAFADDIFAVLAKTAH